MTDLAGSIRAVGYKILLGVLTLNSLICSSTAWAAWNSVSGIKEESDTASEPTNPWDGERLLAFGGTLNFAGSVKLDGELWMQAMNGWSTPVVNIPDALMMSSPSGQFTVINGADLNIGNSAASFVEVGTVTLNQGAQVTLNNMTAYDDVTISDPSTLLHLLDNYIQDGGSFNNFNSGIFDVDGTFTKMGDGNFVVSGTTFTVGDAAASSIEAGAVRVQFGSQVTIGEMLVHGDLLIEHTGSTVHVLNDYVQDGGNFAVANTSIFDVDGTFTKTGNGDFGVGTTSFTIGNPAASSIEAGAVRVQFGSQVTIGEMLVHGDLLIEHTGSTVHVLNDYVQDGGNFAVANTSIFDVDGTFTKTGNGDFGVGTTSFTIGNPAASSIEAGAVRVQFGSQVTIGEMLVHGDLLIEHTGSTVHVLNDYVQDGGNFAVANTSIFDVDGTFTKTGNGDFGVGTTSFTIGNPAASSIEAGAVRVQFGSQVTIGEMLVHGDLLIEHTGSTVHVLNDYVQDGGNFAVANTSIFDVDGTFTKTGSGFFAIGGAPFTIAEPAASSIEAGVISIVAGSQVTIGQVTAHGNVLIENTGSRLQTLGNYHQDAGDFRVIGGSSFQADGTFTKTGSGNFVIGGTNFTLTNAATSSVEAGEVVIVGGSQVTIGDLNAHSTVLVENDNSRLQTMGDFIQDGGNLRILGIATLQVDGAFSYMANQAMEVLNNATITSSTSVLGMSVANSVLVDGGGKATIGHLTAHGNVTVNSPTSILRVGGDYLQDAGGFAIGDNATLNVDGSFRYSVPGARFISFGNGFLRVGDTLTLEEGHFWNPGTSGGRVRVGEGLTVPSAGTFQVTTGGTLAGEGTIVGNLTNTSGTVAPGISAGRLDVTGSYIQGPTSNLSIEIGGSLAELQYDQFFISGSAILAGGLSVDLIDLGSGEFAPILGQSFDILKAGGGLTGTFANVVLPTLGSGLGWDLNYLANRVQLEVVAATSLAGDFDLDGDVDGRDFLKWQRNPGVGNLADWQNNYGTAALSAVTAVPEPASVLLLLGLASVCICLQRRFEFAWL